MKPHHKELDKTYLLLELSWRHSLSMSSITSSIIALLSFSDCGGKAALGRAMFAPHTFDWRAVEWRLHIMTYSFHQQPDKDLRGLWGYNLPVHTLHLGQKGTLVHAE